MGLFFTLLYIVTAYLGPETLFGPLATYHIEIFIALLALLFSLPLMAGSGLLRMPQTYAIIGLSACVAISIALTGWLTGAYNALFYFIPSAMVFFFIFLNCRKKIHLQLLVALLLICALIIIFRGFLAVHTGDALSPYVLTMRNNAGENFFRTRGLSFLNDPNDFSQFLIGLIPCVFLFWKKDSSARNFFFVFLPLLGLMCGMFLTHSRGGMIALMAAAVVAGRRKIGVVPAIILGALLFIGLSAVGWSGGRDVSAESGSDRMEAWSTGLILIRTRPLFGVGFGLFTDYHEITAHNTVIVCAAELGLIGLFSWMLLVVPTVRDAVAGSEDPAELARIKEKRDSDPLRSGPPAFHPGAAPVSRVRFPPVVMAKPGNERAGAVLRGNDLAAAVRVPTEAPGTAALHIRNFLDPADDTDPTTDAEIHRMATLTMISLAGFLTAGWFLSRAYTMTLFTFAGIAAAVYRMARDRKISADVLPILRAAKFAALACVGGVMAVYIIIRLQHLVPGGG